MKDYVIFNSEVDMLLNFVN